MDELNEIKESTEQIPLDRDKKGTLLYSEDIINYIKDELERRRTERKPFELQWTLNANFLAGNQFCDINPHTQTVMQYQPLYGWMEHNSYNKIAPIYETRMALLSTISYNMTVKPRTNEVDDYEKALVSTELLRYTQDTTEFDSKRIQALSWAELTGTAFWVSWWDKDGGEVVARETDEYGTEIILHEGELRYGLLTPYEVFPESVYKQTVEDQRSIIIEQVMTTDDIYDIYGIDVDGESISTYALSPINGGGGAGYETACMTYVEKTVEDSQYVITYFERKSRRYPDGRMAVVIGDTLVYYGTMPYDSIPVVSQKCKETAGVFYGKSIIEGLIPFQRAYNGVKNKIYDYIKTIAVNTLIGEEDAIDMDDYIQNGLEPGGYLPYKGGQKPEQLRNQPIPQAVLQQEQQIVNDMEYFAGVSQMSVSGNTPVGVESGKAIAHLQQIDNTRISLTGENARNAVKMLAKLWLYIYKKFVIGYRVANIVGSNDAGAILTWCADSINSFDINYDAENELLVSDDMQKENFLAAFQMGLFADDTGRIDRRFKEKALEMMKIGNYSEILGEVELQKQNARRENSYFEQGVIPQVDEFDNHQTHIDEHRRYVLQMQFHIKRQKNPEYAQLFIDHIHAHEDKIAETEKLMQQQMLIAQQLQGGNDGKTEKPQ